MHSSLSNFIFMFFLCFLRIRASQQKKGNVQVRVTLHVLMIKLWCTSGHNECKTPNEPKTAACTTSCVQNHSLVYLLFILLSPFPTHSNKSSMLFTKWIFQILMHAQEQVIIGILKMIAFLSRYCKSASQFFLFTHPADISAFIWS